MTGFRLIAMCLALAVPLSGCSWLGFGDDEDEAAPEILAERPHVPVEAVTGIEIGRTRTGFAVTALGLAGSLGWGDAELRARRDGQPAADGFLDFDFVALPPRPELGYGAGTPEQRQVRADLLLPARALQGAAGLRIHGAAGGMQIAF